MTTAVHPPLSSAEGQLRHLADAYYEAKFQRFPIMASELGRHEFDAELGTPDESTFRTDARAVKALLAAVEDLPEHEFAGDGWLDRRCLLAQLRTERMNLS